jgi:hypothetical protein
MKVGFTGHQNAPEQALLLLKGRLEEVVDGESGAARVPRGLSCLAAGADQEFAELVLRKGAELHAVIPSQDYEKTFKSPEDGRRYSRLLERSASITTLPYPNPTEEAFLAGGIVVTERCELLLALWDGNPSSGLGGTGDIVAYARQIGRTTHVMWPEGLVR